METASVRGASARVIAALSAAGRSRTTIKRHEAELNAFARFLQARGRGQDLPTEVDCLDFVAELRHRFSASVHSQCDRTRGLVGRDTDANHERQHDLRIDTRHQSPVLPIAEVTRR